MDIYTILSSKPHNPHYLKRYIKFIEVCQRANENTDLKIHKHHICPKADDMFPEYASFLNYPWNLAKLTPRQHFIAHVIIWKTYPTIRSQRSAVWQMKHKNNEKLNSRLYESLLNDHSKYFSEKIKDRVAAYDNYGNFVQIESETFWQNKNSYVAISADRVVARNLSGEYLVVDVEEFRFRSDLVGTTAGMKMWNNGVRNIASFDKPEPGFEEGIIPLSPEKEKQRTEKRNKTMREKYTKEEIYKMYSEPKKKYFASLSAEERKKSPETRRKMSEAAKIKNIGFSITHICPVCGKEGQKANISRHHGLDGSKCRW